MPDPAPQVAIVDYGLGNLFSVRQACEHAGLSAVVTSSKEMVLSAAAVILPGVGAFGDAIEALRRLDLVSPLRDLASAGTPLVGICLGMQLLMSESEEFGHHQGLGIIKGVVVGLQSSMAEGRRLKVPQIGWNSLHVAEPSEGLTTSWENSLLDGLPRGADMYFVHSFYPKPADPRVVLSVTRYGPTTFCSTLQQQHITACQYHPERSGPLGLRIYRNLATRIKRSLSEVRYA